MLACLTIFLKASSLFSGQTAGFSSPLKTPILASTIVERVIKRAKVLILLQYFAH